LFVKYPDLLKKFVAELLGIQFGSIGEFVITNPEMPPEVLGDKFCRLDINMTVDSQRVDLEVQVNNAGDYPERTLFYWARDYSTALGEGEEYKKLPRVVIINIMDFVLFDCEEFHSEYQALEVTRHTRLTDRMSLHYFELPKAPGLDSADTDLELWLSLFKAQTEEELKRLEALEVPFVEQAITAYRSITATEEFKEIERLRSLARHNEASALGNARREGAEQERQKWESIVADKDIALAIVGAEKEAAIADKDAAIADKDAALADKDAQIAKLIARLSENQ
jgi:predicted transposase/invertase (TIGR01784 family)